MRPDHRRLRLRGRRRHTGRPEDLRSPRRPRHVRHHRHNRPEHPGGHRHSEHRSRHHPSPDKGRGGRHRRRRRKDGHAPHEGDNRGRRRGDQAIRVPRLRRPRHDSEERRHPPQARSQGQPRRQDPAASDGAHAQRHGGRGHLRSEDRVPRRREEGRREDHRARPRGRRRQGRPHST